MKHFIYILASAMLCTPLVAGDFKSARDAVTSELKSLKEAELGQEPWITTTTRKLNALKSALPAVDAAFKEEIQKGIDAFGEIQNQENDTLVLDLFVMAGSFSEYYRSHKDTPAFLQNSALAAAFKSFESGESNDPLAYFNPKLRSLLFTYRHYYPLFNEPVPARINTCRIEYLRSAYIKSETEEGVDDEMVYAVLTDWPLAFAKMKTMSIAVRNTAIQTIELALEDDGEFDAPTKTIARQHLDEAKAFFGTSPSKPE